MKQIGLYILLICLLLACQKEDGITPGIGFENLYTIQDDPNDSIQHKRYELYTTCLLYTSPSPRDPKTSRMPSSA